MPLDPSHLLRIGHLSSPHITVHGWGDPRAWTRSVRCCRLASPCRYDHSMEAARRSAASPARAMSWRPGAALGSRHCPWWAPVRRGPGHTPGPLDPPSRPSLCPPSRSLRFATYPATSLLRPAAAVTVPHRADHSMETARRRAASPAWAMSWRPGATLDPRGPAFDPVGALRAPQQPHSRDLRPRAPTRRSALDQDTD